MGGTFGTGHLLSCISKADGLVATVGYNCIFPCCHLVDSSLDADLKASTEVEVSQ